MVCMCSMNWPVVAKVLFISEAERHWDQCPSKHKATAVVSAEWYFLSQDCLEETENKRKTGFCGTLLRCKICK